MKNDSQSYAVFTEQGSSASQMTAAKVMVIISRPLGCSGQAADAVSDKTQVKMGDAPTLLKKSKVGLPRYLDTSVWKTQLFLFNGICTVIPCQDCCGRSNLRKFFWNTVGEKFRIGTVCSLTEKKDCSCLCK